MILITLGYDVNPGGALTKILSNTSGWLIGAAGWGLGVLFAIFAVGNISGSLGPLVYTLPC